MFLKRPPGDWLYVFPDATTHLGGISKTQVYDLVNLGPCCLLSEKGRLT